jgi:hypothetical protein
MTPIFLKVIINDPLIFAKNTVVFPKFNTLTVTGMTLCVHFGSKRQNLFPLVSDRAKSNSAESRNKGNQIPLSLRLMGIKFRVV